MWRAWAAGDRKGALAAIPDAVVDELLVHGPPAECRERVRAYAQAGVHVPVMALIPPPGFAADALPSLLTALSP
jgi:alkanesulfonate monooxygenase SsuD/methylene tetrahydromethanopterin reductase-like flavin-dependent oxidoreductase (luciferase family)